MLEAIGVACIAFTVFYLLRFNPWVAPYGFAMLAGHASAMAWIAARGWVRPAPSGETAGERLSLHYGRELTRLRHIRQYLWWWYFVPLFVGLFTNLILPGIGASDPTRILLGVGAGIVLIICIAGFNQEQGRRVKQKVQADILERFTHRNIAERPRNEKVAHETQPEAALSA